MKAEFGVMLPHRWKYADVDNISSYARLAEDLGYSHVWVTDHIGVPSNHQERGHIFYESLTTLSYVAATTTKVKLGTCVLVASARNPLVTAKQLSTIDRLSKGRMLLGIGTGWIKEELDAFDIDYEHRLGHLREFIDVLRAVWSKKDREISFHGKYFNFENLIFDPKPFNDTIPILVGGNKPLSVAIAGEKGDGWIPWAIGQSQIAEGIKRMRGKPVYLSGPVQIRKRDARYVGAMGEEHSLLVGDEAELKRKIEEHLALGVTNFVMSFEDVRLFKEASVDEIIRDTRTFASGLMRSF
jgi:probable F420-dependent oxidoreductase